MRVRVCALPVPLLCVCASAPYLPAYSSAPCTLQATLAGRAPAWRRRARPLLQQQGRRTTTTTPPSLPARSSGMLLLSKATPPCMQLWAEDLPHADSHCLTLCTFRFDACWQRGVVVVTQKGRYLPVSIGRPFMTTHRGSASSVGWMQCIWTCG